MRQWVAHINKPDSPFDGARQALYSSVIKPSCCSNLINAWFTSDRKSVQLTAYSNVISVASNRMLVEHARDHCRLVLKHVILCNSTDTGSELNLESFGDRDDRVRFAKDLN